MRKYKSTLYPADLKNTPKLIWDIGMEFRKEVLSKESEKDGRIASNPPMACKYFYFLYLTGSRIGEPLLQPFPKVKLEQTTIKDKTLDIMKVERVNEKHFAEKVYLENQGTYKNRFGAIAEKKIVNIEKSKRAVITQQIPIETEWDAQMWKYVLGRERSDLIAIESMVDFSYFGSYEFARKALGNYITRNFRTDLTDGEHIFKDEGILPHMLRHLRAFNFLVERGWSDTLVQSFLGWDRREMVEYYVYINRMLGAKHQLDLFRKQFKPPGDDWKPPRYGAF